jgi:hypothetical protein
MPQPPLDPLAASVFVGVRLPAPLAERLKDRARRAGVTLSAYTRALFDGEALNASRTAQLEERLKRAEGEAFNARQANALNASRIAELERALAKAQALNASRRAEEGDALNASGRTWTVTEAADEIERLTRANKSLTTANATLRRKVKKIAEDQHAFRGGPMPPVVRMAIIKALHPDKGESTPEAKDAALKRFNAWWSGRVK